MAAPRSLPLESLSSDIRTLIERDGAFCAWCGRRVGIQLSDCTKDHVIPRNRGGKGMLDNYLLSCGPCNHKRKSKNARTYLDQCEREGKAARRAVVEAAIERADAGDTVKRSKMTRRQRKNADRAA